MTTKTVLLVGAICGLLFSLLSSSVFALQLNIIWRMIGAIDGICSIVRNIPKNKIRPFIIPYRQRIPTKTLPFIVLRSVTTYL